MNPSPQQQQQQQQVNNASGTSTNNIIEFQAGVTACIRSWSVLKTAIEQGWGNPIKAEELRVLIFQCMDFSNRTPKKPLSDLYDFEDYLMVFM
jgi:pre-rRNA-processing protein TSR2